MMGWYCTTKGCNKFIKEKEEPYNAFTQMKEEKEKDKKERVVD